MRRGNDGEKPSTKKRAKVTKKLGRPKVARRAPRPKPEHPENFLPSTIRQLANPTGQSQIGNLEPDITECNLTVLTDKHIYFCKRYVLTGGNASKAARESGYSIWYAQNQLTKDPLIIAEIERYRATRANKFEISTDRVIAELCKLAFSNLDDFTTVAKDGTPVIDCTEVGREEMAALSEITQDTYSDRSVDFDGDPVSIPVKKTKIKLHPKAQALEMLMRMLGLYNKEDDANLSVDERARRLRETLKAMGEADAKGQ